MNTSKYDTVVVGGGIAGLTAAAYIARSGQKTVLIEKNREFGGLVNSFSHDGFHFEAGVRALESAGVILPMLEDLGIELEVVRSKVSVGIEDRVLNIEDMSSIDAYRELLVSLYPESASDIKRFIKSMRKIMKRVDVLYGIENPVFKDLKKDKDYLFKKLLPWLPKFIFTVGKINRLRKPVEDYLSKMIKDASLRDIISQHFFKGTPTFFALSYFSLYLDYFYPKGGVGQLAEALATKFQEFGGVLKPEAKIQEVSADKRYVVDDKGQFYAYTNLIWAADLKTFYNITNIENLSASVQSEFEISKASVMAGKGSESVFSLYLEVDLPVDYFGSIANGHFFYTPSRSGLSETHRFELRSLLDKWDQADKVSVMSWLDRFIKLNTFEISIPGLKDESLVPKGKTGVIISIIVEYALFEKVKKSGWYEEFRNEIETKIIHVLSNTVYPELHDKIIHQFSFTPLSIKERVGSTDGAIVGWSFENQIPVVHKIQYSDKSVLTPIPNVFQAGQWAYSPAGVPMSILTGKLAADKINKSRPVV